MYKFKKAVCNFEQLQHEVEDGIWVIYAMFCVFKDRFYFQE